MCVVPNRQLLLQTQNLHEGPNSWALVVVVVASVCPFVRFTFNFQCLFTYVVCGIGPHRASQQQASSRQLLRI